MRYSPISFLKIFNKIKLQFRMVVSLKLKLFQARMLLAFLCHFSLTSFVLITPLFSIEPQIVIHWSSITTPGHGELLKDRNGQLLNAGATSNGDGHLVSLGYFSDSNVTHPFEGLWVPLTFGTRIGDSSSGYGYDDGMFPLPPCLQTTATR